MYEVTRRRSARPAFLVETSAVRVWMESLERRQCLSLTIDPATGNPVRTEPTLDQLPTGYFRYAEAATVSGRVGPYDNALLDIGTGDFSGAVLTLWGRVPEYDRAFLVMDDKPTPARVVDVPGPTFEVRVEHLSLNEDGTRPTRVALLNDHGSDFLLEGPRIVQSVNPLVQVDRLYGTRPDAWTETNLLVPTMLDRESMADSRYRVGITWDDGTATQWHELRPYANDAHQMAFASIDLLHDFHESRTATLIVQRTTGTPASASVSMAFDVSDLESRDAVKPRVPSPTPPPAVPPLSTAYLVSNAESRLVAEPVTRLVFEARAKLPDQTTASVLWADGETELVSPRPIGTTTDTYDKSIRWRYKLDVTPHTLNGGMQAIIVTLRHGVDTQVMRLPIRGIPNGLSAYRYDDEDVKWTPGFEEGIASAKGIGSFWDTDAPADDAYHVLLTLDDGRTMQGQVVSRDSAATSLKHVFVDAPAMWSPNGIPSSLGYYDGQDHPKGIVTIDRPGASIAIPVELFLYTYEWITPTDVPPESIGLPKMLDLRLADGDTAIFNGYRGRLTLPLNVGIDADANDIHVTVQWDRKHASTPEVLRNADGEYVISAVHRYKRFGTYHPTIDVTYGDATATTSRIVYVGDPGPHGSNLLMTDNPVIKTFANVGFAGQGVWHGSVQFVDTDTSANADTRYLAQVRFDDNTPAPAIAFKESHTGSAYRVEFAANFDEPGLHPFTAYIRNRRGETLEVRGVADVQPRSAYHDHWLTETDVLLDPINLPARRRAPAPTKTTTSSIVHETEITTPTAVLPRPLAVQPTVGQTPTLLAAASLAATSSHEAAFASARIGSPEDQTREVWDWIQ